VTIQVSSLNFHECIGPKFAWEEKFNNCDLPAIVRFYKLDNISGLKGLKLLTDKVYYAKSQDQKTLWNYNIRRLEAYVRKFVTKPSPSTRTSTLRDAAALYPGSPVSATSSGK
jgi:hypothetical protein